MRLSAAAIKDTKRPALKSEPGGFPGKLYRHLMENVGAPTSLRPLLKHLPKKNQYTRLGNALNYLRNMYGVDIRRVPVQGKKAAPRDRMYMIPHEKV